MNKRVIFNSIADIAIKLLLSTVSVLLMMSWIFPVGVMAATSQNITLIVQYDNQVPVSLKKYGVNGALLWSDINYESDELVKIFKQIGIVFIRFPGGTIGNFYNWKTGKFFCIKTPDDLSLNRIASMNNVVWKNKITYRLDSFFEFIKNTGSDFSYVLNTICDSPENNANLLSYMKKSNIDLNYVEMGNEIYSRSYAWAFDNSKSYLDSAKKNYFAIRDTYPKAKIGLVVSPVSFNSKHAPGNNGRPNRSWPDRSTQFDIGAAHAKFGNALIIHIYSYPYRAKSVVFDQKTNSEIYFTTMRQFNSRFHACMDYLKFIGKRKPIWITEWGVSAPVEKRNGLFRKHVKSAYHALFMASALVSISLEKGVKIANYHNANRLWQSGKHRTKISPVGNVFSWFITAAKKTETVCHVRAISSGNPASIDKLSQLNGIKSLLFTSEISDYLLVINEEKKTYLINRIYSKDKKFSNYTIGEMYIENDVFKIFDKKVESIDNVVKSGIKIRPYSITKIILKKSS